MDPAVPKIIEGSNVRIKSKTQLITELGETPDGYPNTTTRFNTKGEMDHYFGATGVVTSLNAERGYIAIDFTNKNPGETYGWAISLDMLELDTGIPSPTAKAQRSFMSTATKPTSLQVWRALMALKKKLQLPEGTVSTYFDIYKHKGFKAFKQLIEYTEKGAFISPDHIHGLERIEVNYPEVDIEVVILVYKFILKSSGGSEIADLIHELLKTKRNKVLEIEFSTTPFTPMKRNKPASITEIDKVWEHLKINDTYMSTLSSTPSKSELTADLHARIVKFLNDTNQICLNKGDIIEIGA